MLGIYSHEVGNVRFTAIGDVPRVTLERMVRSLQPVAPAR
jgi:sigma-E factor negative regulatory protein RseB